MSAEEDKTCPPHFCKIWPCEICHSYARGDHAPRPKDVGGEVMTKHELTSTQTLRNGARIIVERHTTPDEVRYQLAINSGAAGSTRIYADAAELRDLQAI